MESTNIYSSPQVDIKLKGRKRGLLVRGLILSVLGAVFACVGSTASAVTSITTRSYDHARTGWNKDEPILKPSNVTRSTFHRVGELRVDDKIEASPLYIAGVSTSSGTRDLLIVATTNNTVYAFDANTHAQVWAMWLGDPVKEKKPEIYKKWGITSTPVVDSDTNTLYVVRWALEGKHKVYRLFGLRLSDGSEEVQSQAIDGFSVKLNDNKYFRNGEQVVRTALGLWRNGVGQKAIVFGASGGEGPTDPSGWVIAYNVAKVRAGGNVTPRFVQYAEQRRRRYLDGSAGVGNRRERP